MDAYDELSCYTLAHGAPAFPHQHIVDASAAQRADGRTKPMTLAFALIGLYLHLERGFTGREVQRVHVLLARRKHRWPTFPLPARRGALGPADVLAAAPGAERDAAIDAWCASVWEEYAACRPAVVALLKEHGIA